ncbi:hypothetical protein [Halobacterium noricense]|uniref:hypothetical protein n=1 Tax=Halobacterium noricense TaxID=223182 RepID=UPI001E5626D7|nr:hypothetical protein [Halobacterium noricense]UHH26585.1 hypothetical protein LT974_06530 [Halobacterium noricense]
MPTNSSPNATDARSTIERILDGSRIVDAVQRLSTTAKRWLNATTERLTRVVQGSFLYRWLTAEPDPEVIVIDLRETYTVGPFIAILDRVVETLVPYYRQSLLKRGVDGLAAHAARAADTRPGRLLVALFEPPEPPEGRDEPRDDRHDRDDE